ncbi:MAG: VIT1/CCC1 transporter family protein [Patescibacteria group bacterium]
MSAVNLTIKEAKKLHHDGQAEKIHGVFDSGLLKAAVFGANDGIVTTFAVVAGVAGAGLSPSIILIMGIANLIADGISMGMGDYLGERSERRHKQHQFEIEKWEIRNIPNEEKTELIEYFVKKGVDIGEAEKLASTITKYPKLWTELGFIDEMGVVPNFDGKIWKTGAMTFLAFMLAGSLPLMPYFVEFAGFPLALSYQFPLSILSTAGTLFFVGSLRTFITKGTWWKNGLEMLVIGATAASAAYIVGALIENFLK